MQIEEPKPAGGGRSGLHQEGKGTQEKPSRSGPAKPSRGRAPWVPRSYQTHRTSCHTRRRVGGRNRQSVHPQGRAEQTGSGQIGSGWQRCRYGSAALSTGRCL